MKWKTRFIICNLLAGLITLTYSGCRDAPAVQLLSSQTLDFPSASGIEFYEGKLVLFGDNAPYLLVLSPSYQVLQKITYWRDTAGVISKEEKPDIESALLTEKNGKTVVMGIGSQSGANRWPVYAWTVGEDSVQKSKFFPDRLRFPGIQEINLEGSTRVNNQFVFCNRANLTTKINHLIFWTEPGRFAVKEIRLPRADSAAGLSGLYYIKEKDLLLFTATEEATYSATEDGAIVHD